LNGAESKITYYYNTGTNVPFNIFYSDQPKDYRFIGESIVYTDYDNIAVFFSCMPRKEGLLTIAQRKFYISVRERSFNNATQLLTVLEVLAKFDVDLNDIHVFYQDSIFCSI
jgi:hypothetical protein